MELDRFQLALRPRNHWEAMDLGVLLIRRWWRPLYLAWLLVALPVMLLSGLVLSSHPGWAALLVWWFKPLYERLPLFMLSRGIFSEWPSTAQALSQWRRWLPLEILPRLTYRRFSFTRSFTTPVDVLEGLHGSQRMERLKVLGRSGESQAFWLTVICVHVEAFLSIGILTLIFMLIPQEVEIDWWGLLVTTQSGGFDWLTNCSISSLLL